MSEPSLCVALAALDRPMKPSDWLRIVAEFQPDAGFWWLDSATADPRLGRYSFAGSDPYLSLRARGREIEIDVHRDARPGLASGLHARVGDPIEVTRSLLPRAQEIAYSARASSGGAGITRAGGAGEAGAVGDADWCDVDAVAPVDDVPFLGGAVGYFGYELAAVLEPQLTFANADALALPDLFLCFVDRVVAYDHRHERLWLFGLGFGDASTREAGAARTSAVRASRDIADALSARVGRCLTAPRAIACDQDDQTSRANGRPLEMRSTVDASGYAKAIDSILEDIDAGNVYQANFSQRLTVDADLDPWDLYQALRLHNPAPFGGYLGLPEAAILSSSPERFLELDRAGRVESRPIKGTRPRGADVAEDAQLSAELSSSAKDRAENLMIVDLVRNDLGRVCSPGSIEVPELMKIEAYAEVFQMVSTVTGTLAAECDGFDLIRATFPPGSMTGAPKLAAIELLEKLEQERRGVYAGALGYLDLRGGLDLSVVIRTIVWQQGQAHLHVGGGVVADSTPSAEYLESLDKAKAPLAALEDAVAAVRQGDR